MSVKRKIVHDSIANNPIELQQYNSRKLRRKVKITKSFYRFIHSHRTFKRLIVGLLVYIVIMIIFITLIFFFVGSGI